MVEKISPGAGLEPGTASSVGQPDVRKFCEFVFQRDISEA